jgi:RNA polymerase sigma factor (sigma-70 family)
MATAQLGSLLRYVHKLAAGRGSLQRTDRELLDDFSARRDEAAFAALVARHGPMVLRVCQRVLNHEQDAEDAFQASFLILARKSASIRKREALAEWLHGVAYRTAMEVKRNAARRRDHEARLWTVMRKAAVSPTWDDVRAVLDEEIQRLPETYRAAFVLCLLEGKSGPQAAAQLGIKEGAVRTRLMRARQLLHQRLVHRGIELSVLLAALSVAESAAQAGLPAVLAKVTVRFGLLVAAGETAAGVIPSHIAALAAGVTRAMFLTKAKIAVALLFAVGLVATGASVLTCQALAAKETPPVAQKAEPPAKEATKPQAAHAKPINAPKVEANDTVEVSGRVLDPDGKPVQGAKLVFLYASTEKVPEKVWATSTADGRFHFSVPKSIENDVWSGNAWDYTHVVAAADGYGFAVARVRPEASRDMTLRLVKDDVPIQGRVLDLQGKPVAGVTVRIDDQFYLPMKGDLTAWLEGLKANKQKLVYMDLPDFMHVASPAFATLFPPITTGADGRFTLKGIGRERVVSLRFQGPTIATKKIMAMTRPVETIRLALKQPRITYTYYGARFDFVPVPTRPIEGVVRDKETGKPLAGVTIQGQLLADDDGLYRVDVVRTTTDQKGRYRLVGLPKGEGNIILARPCGSMAKPGDLPYFPAASNITDTSGLEPITIDIGLKRGIWVKGRVIDKATGKTVPAGIQYFCFQDNPNAAEVHAISGIPPHSTQKDGSFRIVALPGRGVIAVRGVEDKYRLAVGADRINGRREGQLFATQPYELDPGNFHTVVEISPKPGDASITCDVVLDPGRTLKGTVFGPDSKPLAGARVSGLTSIGFWDHEPLKQAEFAILSLGPDETRLLQMIHEKKKLAGWLRVRGDEKGPIRIRLEAWGTFTGRLVTPDGEPMTNVTIHAGSRGGQPDKDGKFRIDGLAPGLKYSLSVIKEPSYGLEIISKNAKDLTVKPAETKNLGDIQVKPVE